MKYTHRRLDPRELNEPVVDPADQRWYTPRKSTRYSRMYEDCTFYRVPRTDGRPGTRTIPVYRGFYYQAAETPAERRRYRLRLAALLLVLCAVFGWVCTLSYAANTVWYVGISEGAAFVGLVQILITLLLRLTTEPRLTGYFYKLTSLRFITSCRVCCALLGLCAAATAVSLVRSGAQPLRHIAAAAAFCLCAGAAWAAGRVERRRHYRRWLSEDQPPQDAVRAETQA
jgi:hypothetical protein